MSEAADHPAPRRRRTQAERSTATRARILTATADCLLERGHQATTISEVQQRTGLARGTIQHHFPTRADLLVAALSHLVDVRIAQFRAESARISPGADRMHAVVDLILRDLTSPIFFAALELWVAARTDADLRRALLPEEARLFAALHSLYRETLGEPYASDERVETLVEFTVDLVTGLTMTTMLTGDDGRRQAVARRWKRALTILIGSAPASDLLTGRPLDQPASTDPGPAVQPGTRSGRVDP
ncbi:TetR/AcrR family transcriptional regulator [Nocardioides sambongensis]|uniref:TetR/AcrR family transcriptional regulator n=1 Tax=Nocardioides sambongensis TaxID=2589074 RepID=UPI00112CAF38|nr:TetR/AcrR family transcriptional regulator [Nocardioides sambongensis]